MASPIQKRINELREQLKERDEQRSKLLQQQAALKSVVASIPYHVFWKDRESVYLGCNEAFATSAGLARPDERE